MKKIALFSGTFDPIHSGHIDFARLATQEYGLDKVIFLVEPQPRRKPMATAYSHRLRMVELAIMNEPHMETLILDQPRFAVETTLPLLKVKTETAKLYFMLGDDILQHMAHWPHIDQLLRSVILILAARHNSRDVNVLLIEGLQTMTKVPVDYVFINKQIKPISSQAIREELKYNRPPSGVPAATVEYIAKNKLYS